MSEYLTIEEATNRDESGNITPDVITVEKWPGDEKPKIKYVPISKGKFQVIFGKTKRGKTDRDIDEQIISDHVVNPKLSADNLKAMSLAKINALIIAVFSGSTGRKQDEVEKLMSVGLEEIAKLEIGKKKDLGKNET